MSNCSTGPGDLSDYPFLAEKIVCSTGDAKRALDCGQTTLYALISTGEIESYLEGKSRKIIVASLVALVNRRLEAARVQRKAA
jgi:hypothetical protein